jgi:hypothetical protein
VAVNFDRRKIIELGGRFAQRTPPILFGQQLCFRAKAALQ